jgi:hypothetical protein
VPIVVRVRSGDGTGTFAANAIRASVPPDRIADVHVEVVDNASGGTPPDEEWRRLSAVTQREAHAAIADAGGRALIANVDAAFPFELTANAEPAAGPGVTITADGFEVRAADAAIDPLEPSSPAVIAAASFAVLALLWIVGYGWARTAVDPVAAVALAPGFGLASLILTAVVADRVGVPLDGWVGPTAVSAVAGLGGYLLLLLLGAERQVLADPPSQVEQ